MTRSRYALVVIAAATGLLVAAPVQAAPSPAPQGARAVAEHAVCGPAAAGAARCHAHVVEYGSQPGTEATSGPSGLAPSDIDAAYGFTGRSSDGAGQTIAIVDAYDSPNVASDLQVFSDTFGITCDRCLTKVDQRGGTSYPRSNAGWALEISLDVEWAHAIAPGAHILLVEADSNSYANLMAAVDYAKAHADYVSMSWGGSEFSGEQSYDSHFVQPGVSFFVSSGDAGLPANYPSSSPNVISVGGTTLHYSNGVLTDETAWSSGGGGCSAYENATPAQQGFTDYGQAGCGQRRATPDVALDADPSSGVSVYDTTKYYGQTGWFTVGGTSASAPMWAARAAASGSVVDAGTVYGTTIPFRDITSGNNGAPALTGYDLASGRGSWADTPISGGGTGTTDAAPSASNVTVGTQQDTVVAVTLTGSDAETCELAFTVATGPSHGSLGALADQPCVAGTPNTDTATVPYTPVAGYTGSDSFTYTVTDSVGLTSTATVSITVTSTATLQMSVTSIAYDTAAHGKHLRVTVTLEDSDGRPVSGASVSIELDLDGAPYASGTATTASGGTVTFQAANAPPGSYSTTITDASAPGYVWDTVTPPNSFTKTT